MKVNLQDVFKFPLKDKNWITNIFIGGLFLLCSFMLLPVVFPLGYLVAIVRNSIAKKKALLPAWEAWEDFLQDGFFVFLIAMAYALPCMIVGIVFSVIATFIFGFIPYVGWLIAFFVCITLTVLFAFVLGPVIAVASCLYISTGEVSSAFQIQKMIELLKNGLTEYVIISGVSVSSMVAIFIISLPTLFLVFPFIAFYVLVVISRMYGEAFIKYAEDLEEHSLESKV